MSGPDRTPVSGPDGDGTGLSQEEWHQILDGLKPPTYNEVVRAIQDAFNSGDVLRSIRSTLRSRPTNLRRQTPAGRSHTCRS